MREILEFKRDILLYELKVSLVQENGNIKETIYTYTFLNGKPVLTFSTRSGIGKTGWKVALHNITGQNHKLLWTIDLGTLTSDQTLLDAQNPGYKGS